MKIGIVGGSGYLGAELLRLLANHPEFEVTVVQADSAAGSTLSSLYPGLTSAYGDTPASGVEIGPLLACEVVFVAVPSGASQRIIPQLVGNVPLVVDLGADFRLKDPAAYEQWYGFTHGAPELLSRAVYGLVERNRDALVGADFIAAPGCYVTAASLALGPLAEAGIIESSGLIIDAASGTSGAGKEPLASTHHSLVNENFVAYGVCTHRHTPEIEQAIGAQVLLTPHLLPMTRGILATCYAKPSGTTSTDELLAFFARTYSDEPFIQITEQLPATRETYGTNNVRITARYDGRTDTVIVLSAIDNLTKGGAGQAIQAANVALGLPEELGLPKVALLP